MIILEKGRNHLVSLEPPYEPSGDLSNDEIKFLRRHFLGPDPFLEPRTYRRTDADGDRLYSGEVNSLPTTVGGGGFHADGKLPRLREEDFNLLSARGPIDGAAIDDWPLDYADLEPHYAIAEHLIGVAGDAGKNPFEAWRSSPYPINGMSSTGIADNTAEGAPPDACTCTCAAASCGEAGASSAAQA